MANHTPGPWTVYQGRKPIDPYESEVITDEKGQAGSVVICRLAGANRQENAALIAAAPELLQAVEEIVENCPCRCGGWGPEGVDVQPCPSCDRLKAVIAKAKGE